MTRYLVTEDELALLTAMIYERNWEGEEKKYISIMEKLLQKGFIHDAGGTYLIDEVIYGLIKCMNDLPDDQIERTNKSIVFHGDGMDIILESDPHRKKGKQIGVIYREEAL